MRNVKPEKISIIFMKQNRRIEILWTKIGLNPKQLP